MMQRGETPGNSDRIPNSERFLGAFNRIDKHLRKVLNVDREIPFMRMVREASESNHLVLRVRDALADLSELRNAIIHDSTDGHVIAEPNNQVIEEIERVLTFLVDAPKIIPMFQRKVVILSATDPVTTALEYVNRYAFSQFPVYSGRDFCALLTTNAIVHWLANCHAGGVHLDVPVEKVLPFAEDTDNCVFMSRNKTPFDVVSIVRSYEKKGKKLGAILITQDGRKDEQLLGIITMWDLPEVYEKLGLTMDSVI
ncbi:MAG: CBS domain-containing protein [Chloroflexi bacterium]|nr:CBS domain-containing protein [Chloroflexota bacterium]